MRLGKLTSILEILGVSVGSVYACGFLAQRGALSFLGVGAQIPILNDRYAEEGGLFVLATLEVLLFPIGFLGCALGLTVFVAHRFLLRFDRWRKIITSLQTGRSWIEISLALVLTKLVESMFREHLGEGGLLFEPAPVRAAISLSSSAEHYIVLVVLTVISTLLVCVLCWPRRAPTAPFWLRVYVAALLGLQLVLLPINYGVLIKSRVEYPVARVETGSTNDPSSMIEGPLLLETDQEVVIFAEDRIFRLRRDEIKRIEVLGYRDVFANPSRHQRRKG